MAKTAENQENSGKLAEFFDVLGNKSPSTINGYKSAIWSFIQFNFNLTDAQKGHCAEYVDQYFEDKDVAAVILDFKKYMQTKDFQKKAPLGAKQQFLQLKTFFDLVGFEISKKDVKRLSNQLPQGGKASEESYLTTDMINQMIQHTDIKGKSVLLALASSGMRIGELVNIRCNDVHFPTAEVPVTWLYIRKPKNKLNRHTHISTEATAALREWIKVRPGYLQSNQNRGLGLMSKKQKEAGLTKEAKNTEDDRLFPMAENTVRELVVELVTKVNGENATCDVTGRSLIHPHTFRKFFETQLTDAKMVSGVIKALAGQVTNLEKTYVTMTPAQTAKHYIAAEHALYIEGTPEIREAATNNTKKFAQINEAQQTSQNLINKLTLENMTIKEKNAEVLEQVRTLTEKMTAMEETQAVLQKVFSALPQDKIDEIVAALKKK